MYVDQEVKVKNCVQHLSQTLAVINDLACIRNLSPTGSLYSFEPGNRWFSRLGRQDPQKANWKKSGLEPMLNKLSFHVW